MADRRLTVIGRRDDVTRCHGMPGIDTWWLSGRIPGPGEPQVTWAENRQWLDYRIVGDDAFGIATDPATLPAVAGGFAPGCPNGYFTALELRHLRSRGIEPEALWRHQP